MPNLDEIAKLITEKWELLASITVIIGSSIVASIAFLIKCQRNRQQQARLRQIPRGDFPFEVIKPGSSDLLKQIMGGDEQNPLADCNIPYQERQPELNVRQELEAAFAEKNWVLILGKSGLGKTREAAHLADVLNKEGWTVLKLKDQPGEWLDVPKQFPRDISPDDKLLFFLDDLNRWMYAGNPHEVHPKAGEDLARPLREAVQERLPRLLQYFEQQGKSPYVRVIATARDEREPDKPGDLSPWEKLQWEKYKAFWQQFQRYLLVEPSEGTIVRLLTDCVAVAGLRGNPAEYGQMARRNDGTFRNITLNLASAQSRGLAVNDREFSPRLDETWRQRYNKVVQRYPLAKHVYDAVELLRTLNLGLTVPMLFATTKLLLPGRGVQRWWQAWQLRPALDYLVRTEHIQKPNDGQIEAKKTVAVDVRLYVPKILFLLGQMAKKDPSYPVADEYLNCGFSLFNLEYFEEVIISCNQYLRLKPDNHQIWQFKGIIQEILKQRWEAVSSYDHVLQLNPDNDIVWDHRGVNMFFLEQYEEAIANFDEALKLNPDNYSTWETRGLAMCHLEQYEEAITSFVQASKLHPSSRLGWKMQGLAMYRMERYKEAIVSLDQALKLSPDDHQISFARSIAYEFQDYEEVIIRLEKLWIITPDDQLQWKIQGFILVAVRRHVELALYDLSCALHRYKDEYS
jgi:tetratricopeptide (TPR) repeat protein